MFMAVAVLGLWLSRDYPIGTAFRMGTGYVPRLLCWILLGLGGVVFIAGLREAQASAPSAGAGWAWRPVVFVTASLVIFGLAIERLGLVVSIRAADRLGAFRVARLAAARDGGCRAGADRSVLGDLHPRARAHDPGLAGVVDGAAPQPRGRLRGGNVARQPLLRAGRRADRDADRRAARHRPDRHHRDAAAADLPSRADLAA